MAVGLSIIEMGLGEIVMGSYNVGYASFNIFREEPEDFVQLFQGSVRYLLSKTSQRD
jgi:hypothetical protein